MNRHGGGENLFSSPTPKPEDTGLFGGGFGEMLLTKLKLILIQIIKKVSQSGSRSDLRGRELIK